MKTITALFDRLEDAQAAADALERAGVPTSSVSIVSNGVGTEDGAAAGAGIGAALGGAGGLLAGLGAFAIPGVGPVIGAGWLATTLIGAAAGGVAGGLVGSLADAGVPEADAHVYAEGVRRGGTLVTARVEDRLADTASAILGQGSAADISERRSAYAGSGWSAFDQGADPWSIDEIDEERRRYERPVPVVPIGPTGA